MPLVGAICAISDTPPPPGQVQTSPPLIFALDELFIQTGEGTTTEFHSFACRNLFIVCDTTPQHAILSSASLCHCDDRAGDQTGRGHHNALYAASSGRRCLPLRLSSALPCRRATATSPTVGFAARADAFPGYRARTCALAFKITCLPGFRWHRLLHCFSAAHALQLDRYRWAARRACLLHHRQAFTTTFPRLTHFRADALT